MNQIFTTNHLIRFAYNETGLQETALISKSIAANPALASEYEQLTESIRFLDAIALEPSENSLNSVLLYLNSNNPIN